MTPEEIAAAEAAKKTDEGGEADKSLTPEEAKELREKLAKAEELANNYKTRAEKAEKAKPKADDTTSKNTDISARDILSLQSAGVTTDEDISFVERMAKAEGLTIKEVLDDKSIQTVLKTRQEERKSTEVTNTSNERRGSVRLTTEKLLSEASKGNLPESAEDQKRLIRSKFNLDK